MPKPSDKKRSSSSNKKTTDERFASFGTDPRFRLPSGKTKTKLDSRFKKALKDKDFTETAKVDRYGRKLKSNAGKKALKRLYEVEDEEEDDDEDEQDEEVDPRKLKLDDKAIRRELKRANEKYDPARDGGFSESESDSDSDSEVESDEDETGAVGDLQKLEPSNEEIPEGEVTNRLAIVNLDWDHVKSTDLMVMFTSFVPAGGNIERISIYPSEFGKERMAREEAGPPQAIFKSNKTASNDVSEDDEDEDGSEDSEDDDEKVKKDLIKEGDDQDFNTNELRAYQLDRLRYYYAVMICSDKATAKAISDATDGREFQASSNFLDLRFVPDDTAFDDAPRDECTSIPDKYKPIDFVTDALSHSKVKLTWDMHPEEAARKDSIKHAFTGNGRKMTEDDMNLHMYLASDNSDDEEDDFARGDDSALSKKELARQKMREALGLGPEPTSKSAEKGPVGDLQITFSSALSDKKKSKESGEETTIEKYQRKEKERKQRRKQKAEAEDEAAEAMENAQEEDLGFDDPFFTTAPGDEPKESKTSVRKEERRKKREAREADEKQRAAEKEKLELLMGNEDGEDDIGHFDMNEIVRAEKRGKKKKKHLKERADRGGLQEDFKMEVDDPRFKAIYEDHEFAIDPSHAKFKKTPGMEKLLEEGRKKRKNRDEHEERRLAKQSKRAKTDEDELAGLLASVKRKVAEKGKPKK